ncbi:fibronectin type III domain-containing protein [Marinobacter halodurans]|uniref:Fibronectin type III domain-containing protein n=2 Tax=Marinobacter halodurans TaxID=2528979 RepID=A0ABY1ZLN1_9GAMM|nr:fibronectin type III domain-containing protein [Marinobacter halodurans]
MGELQGYEIVYGHTADTLDNVIVIDSASTTTHTIENLDQGDWYFAVRAIDTEGLVSPLSAVVSKSISG